MKASSLIVAALLLYNAPAAAALHLAGSDAAALLLTCQQPQHPDFIRRACHWLEKTLLGDDAKKAHHVKRDDKEGHPVKNDDEEGHSNSSHVEDPEPAPVREPFQAVPVGNSTAGAGSLGHVVGGGLVPESAPDRDAGTAVAEPAASWADACERLFAAPGPFDGSEENMKSIQRYPPGCYHWKWKFDLGGGDVPALRDCRPGQEYCRVGLCEPGGDSDTNPCLAVTRLGLVAELAFLPRGGGPAGSCRDTAALALPVPDSEMDRLVVILDGMILQCMDNEDCKSDRQNAIQAFVKGLLDDHQYLKWRTWGDAMRDHLATRVEAYLSHAATYRNAVLVHDVDAENTFGDCDFSYIGLAMPVAREILKKKIVVKYIEDSVREAYVGAIAAETACEEDDGELQERAKLQERELQERADLQDTCEWFEEQFIEKHVPSLWTNKPAGEEKGLRAQFQAFWEPERRKKKSELESARKRSAQVGVYVSPDQEDAIRDYN